MKRVALLLCLAVVGSAQAQEKASPAPSHSIVALSPDALEWVASTTLPPGAQVAVLQGDPAQSGLFVVRVVYPVGFVIPPHYHPTHEHVTVLRGALNIGMGDKFDKAATTPLVAGSFATMPAGMSHFVWVDAETELQIHGTGPFTLSYVNPADDPRRKKP